MLVFILGPWSARQGDLVRAIHQCNLRVLAPDLLAVLQDDGRLLGERWGLTHGRDPLKELLVFLLENRVPVGGLFVLLRCLLLYWCIILLAHVLLLWCSLPLLGCVLVLCGFTLLGCIVVFCSSILLGLPESEVLEYHGGAGCATGSVLEEASR